MGYPNAPKHVASWLAAQLNPDQTPTGVKAGTKLPTDLTYVMPYIFVARFAGPSGLGLDVPVLDIDVYDHDEDNAWNTADQVREAMERRLRHTIHEGMFVTGVTTEQGPVERASGSTAWRFQATYRLGVRNA